VDDREGRGLLPRARMADSKFSPQPPDVLQLGAGPYAPLERLLILLILVNVSATSQALVPASRKGVLLTDTSTFTPITVAARSKA
jgi:hypothetical protein